MTILRVFILSIAAAFFLSACDNNEGPMERAGEKIDNAATDTGNALEDACEDAKDNMGAEDTDC